MLAVLSAIRCIARPSTSGSMPVWSWKAANEWISGVVSTPPKSEITALDHSGVTIS